jgi:hypothetical protein
MTQQKMQPYYTSLMGCCKAADVNFRKWFVYFPDNVHAYDTDYSMDSAELLPHNWNLKQTWASSRKIQIVSECFAHLLNSERQACLHKK